MMIEEDSFYEKLNKLNESSGLSLLFNFRDTTLDLQQLYKNVTQRGGYHEVTKDGKWEEVACSMSRESRFLWTPSQLEKIYATILYVFEQTYHYRCPIKKSPKRPHVSLGVSDLSSSTKKRKHDDVYYMAQQHFSDGGTPPKEVEHSHGFGKLSPVLEKKGLIFGTTRYEVMETRKAPCVPLGSRNCYQMFIKMETDKLNTVSSLSQLKCMNETWKRLSNKDKQPYIKASKKDKERYVREMGAYEEHKRKQRNRLLPETTQNAIKFTSPNPIELTTHSPEAVDGTHTVSCQDARKQKFVDFGKIDNSVQFDGDYHVALQTDDDHESALESNESAVQMAVGLMKNARPCDPIFEIEWDVYGSS